MRAGQNSEVRSQESGGLILESEVREMRDRVFENPTTDNNWEACREGWMMPDSIRWLRCQMEPRGINK